jgi:hypothetical protein
MNHIEINERLEKDAVQVPIGKYLFFSIFIFT